MGGSLRNNQQFNQFFHSKERIEWICCVDCWAAGIKVSAHAAIAQLIPFIDSPNSSINSINFTFALFTSTFIPLYCYNTFWFHWFRKERNQLNQNEIYFLFGFVDGVNGGRLPARSIKDKSFNFAIKKVIGFQPGHQPFTHNQQNFSLSLIQLINLTPSINSFSL